MAFIFCFLNISKEIKIIIIMKWHYVKNNHIFPLYWLIHIVYLIQKYWTLLSFTTFEFTQLSLLWNFFQTAFLLKCPQNNRILLIIAEMVITIFQPITCICVFFPLKISKLWKLFKFQVVQSGPTAGPLVNPIPLVPEKKSRPLSVRNFLDLLLEHACKHAIKYVLGKNMYMYII